MNNSLYVDEILTDLKKLPKTAKIVLVFGIAFAIMFLVGLIFAFTNTDEMMAFVFILCGSIFSLMFFGILLGKKIKSNKRMKNIDLNQLRNELMQGVVEFEGTKTYFTNNYMLSNYYYTFVIKYSDIAWVYKHDKTNQYGTVLGSDLMICLKNKKKEYTTFGEAFIEEILRHNPNVLVGYSFENKKIYKNMCKDYNFEPEISDYSEDYWLTDNEEADEEDFDLLHLTSALETLNNAIDKIGNDAEKAAAAIEKVINTYYNKE